MILKSFEVYKLLAEKGFPDESGRNVKGDDMEYYGSCLCKKVKYKVTGTIDKFYLCHCKYCRKDSGSAHGANLFIPEGDLTWLKGGEFVRTFLLDGTQHQKAFCTVCGSALPNLQMEGKVLVLPAGSLDSPLDRRPDGHMFISHKAGWDQELETVVKFDTFPER